MRIFYNQSVDAIARRLIPGIAVAALAAWGRCLRRRGGWKTFRS